MDNRLQDFLSGLNFRLRGEAAEGEAEGFGSLLLGLAEGEEDVRRFGFSGGAGRAAGGGEAFHVQAHHESFAGVAWDVNVDVVCGAVFVGTVRCDAGDFEQFVQQCVAEAGEAGGFFFRVFEKWL